MMLVLVLASPRKIVLVCSWHAVDTVGTSYMYYNSYVRNNNYIRLEWNVDVA